MAPKAKVPPWVNLAKMLPASNSPQDGAARKELWTRMDFNGNRALDQSEFEQALAAFGYV